MSIETNSNAPIQEKIDVLVKKFSSLSDWEDRYRYIITLGKELGPMDDQYKTDQYKVKGCQSQVWLFADMPDNERIIFSADSDASIVKGIIAVLMSVYNNSTPEEVLNVRPTFLDDIGLRQHLSMSRANGLASMVKQITMYAMAFQAKKNMSEVSS